MISPKRCAAAAAVIVAANRDLFFETRHVGRLLESLAAEEEK